MGSWIGRAGRGAQAWLTYSFTPRSKIELGYRLQEVSHEFLEGGRSADYSVSGELALMRGVSASGFVQFEQWRFPLLATNRQSDITAGVQLTFRPALHFAK
jgi:hypothetical protein